MKTKFCLVVVSAILTSLIMGSCETNDATSEDKNMSTVGVTFTSEQPTANEESTVTRTSLSHTQGGGAEVFWSTGDYIWVKDNSANFRQSNVGTLDASKKVGVFTMPAGSTYVTGCTVHYTGNSGNADKVNIAATQTQATPNDFSHAGTSGDCGITTASGSGNSFSFQLNHKAAYLCLLPRCENAALAPNIRLTKIVVSCTTPIAGVYDFASGTIGATPLSGASNSITLTTGGSTGFAINTSTSISANGSYVVMAPAQTTRTLTIQYYLTDPTTGVSGYLTKQVSGVFLEGKIYDITARLDPPLSSEWYMWDAVLPFWYGYEDERPVVNGGYGPNYPKSQALDPDRWYNTVAWPAAASQSCKECPNVNAMLWYMQRGDPRWNANGLFTFNNHLYKGGVWIKKWDKISGRTSAYAPDGVDYTRLGAATVSVQNTSLSSIPPSPSVIDDYFFLPADGNYAGPLTGGSPGTFYNFLIYGNYWSSTPHPTLNTAYRLGFGAGIIQVNAGSHRSTAFHADKFK